MRDKGLLLAGLALLVVGIGGLALLGSGVPVQRPGAGTAAGRGAWIFQTATAPNGQPIPYTGGMMMTMSCANCHGIDGRGLQTPMFVAPNITYHNLTNPAGMIEPDGTRGPRYADNLIRRAVTQGVDPEGKSLDWPMPRWQFTNREWDDLLAYLKTLP